MADQISTKLIDFIISQEVSSKAVYEKNYQRPTWPGGGSGITVGIGYDLGYQSQKVINDDWSDLLDRATVNNMMKYAGINGQKAKSYVSQAKKEIVVPWDAAYRVFCDKNIPMFTNELKRYLPNTDDLSEDCLGVLVSIAYNRGNSWNSSNPRHEEMRNIKTFMKNKQFDKIPNEIRKMKRLWPDLPGLVKRREAEAKLFEAGLTTN